MSIGTGVSKALYSPFESSNKDKIIVPNIVVCRTFYLLFWPAQIFQSGWQ